MSALDTANAITPLSTTTTPITAVMMTGPLRSFDRRVTNGCTAPGACRSSTSDCNSPNVAALVAAAHPLRCSSPTADRRQRAVEYLAGVIAVAVLGPGARCLPVATTMIVRGREPSPQTDADARGHVARHASVPAGRRTLVIVRLQRQVVDYALRRRSLLAEVYSGRTGVTEVCDANPYLLRAAKYHGKPSSVMCPICRKEQLTLVSWVFGDHLGAVSGIGAHRRGIGVAGDPIRRVRGARGGGMPNLQLESLGQVIRARRATAPKARGTRTARNGARTASE